MNSNYVFTAYMIHNLKIPEMCFRLCLYIPLDIHVHLCLLYQVTYLLEIWCYNTCSPFTQWLLDSLPFCHTFSFWVKKSSINYDNNWNSDIFILKNTDQDWIWIFLFGVIVSAINKYLCKIFAGIFQARVLLLEKYDNLNSIFSYHFHNQGEKTLQVWFIMWSYFVSGVGSY